jgi:type I restriction enzyme, S subunit
MPPPAEQLQIATYLDECLGRLDDLAAEAERAIALLRERRAALISAAVTGKIDVRNSAATEKQAAAA